MNKIVDIRYLT